MPAEASLFDRTHHGVRRAEPLRWALFAASRVNDAVLLLRAHPEGFVAEPRDSEPRPLPKGQPLCSNASVGAIRRIPRK